MATPPSAAHSGRYSPRNLEMASTEATWQHLTQKRKAYAAMGVPEYWLFDPQACLFPPGEPQLQG